MKRKGGPGGKGGGEGGNKQQKGGQAKKQKTQAGAQQGGGAPKGNKNQNAGGANQQQGQKGKGGKKGNQQQQKATDPTPTQDAVATPTPTQNQGGKKGGNKNQNKGKGAKKGGATQAQAAEVESTEVTKPVSQQPKKGKKGGNQQPAGNQDKATPTQQATNTNQGGKKGKKGQQQGQQQGQANQQGKGKKKGAQSKTPPASPGKATTFDQILSLKGYSYLETAKQLLTYLLAPIDVTTFFKDNWEKEPIHIPRNNAKYYGNKTLFTREDFKKIAEAESLFFERHLNVFTYHQEEGLKEDRNKYVLHSHNKEDDEDVDEDQDDDEDMDMDPLGGDTRTPGIIQADELDALFSDKCTFQILHPQQYNDKIHTLVYLFEEYFSSLVGSNVYMTPAGNSQGLAPHFDSAELFVLQLSGSKKWKLYSPSSFDKIPLDTLPNESSDDIPREFLPKPDHEYECKPGDLLYIPRGYVHEASTTSEESNHITLSTYEKNNWGAFVRELTESALEQVMESDEGARSGVPLNFVVQGPNRTAAAVAVEHSKKILESMISTVSENSETVNRAMDNFALDFMTNRITPPDELIGLEDDSIDNLSNETLLASGKVRLRNPGWLLLAANEDEDEEEEEEEEEDDEEGYNVFSCVGNEREMHMTGEVDEEDANAMQIPSKVGDFVKEMQRVYPEWVDIKGSALNESNVEYVILLASRGLVEVKD